MYSRYSDWVEEIYIPSGHGEMVNLLYYVHYIQKEILHMYTIQGRIGVSTVQPGRERPTGQGWIAV